MRIPLLLLISSISLCANDEPIDCPTKPPVKRYTHNPYANVLKPKNNQLVKVANDPIITTYINGRPCPAIIVRRYVNGRPIPQVQPIFI